MQSRAQTAWDVIAWDVIGTVLFRVLLFGGFYAFASWCCMVFWGIVAERAGIASIGYDTALIATLGLWLTVGPAVWLVAYRVKRGSVIDF